VPLTGPESILTICQDVAREAGFGAPPSLVGNSDDTAQQLLAMANRAGRHLALLNWQNLQLEHTFPTTPGIPNYPLPPDFARYVNDTAWDRTTYWKVRGSLSPQDWQRYKSSLASSSSPWSRFRIQQSDVWIDPTPTSVRNLVIEYISNGWCDSAASFVTKIQTDADTVVFDGDLFKIELLWRFLNRKGLAYGEEKREAELLADRLIGMNTPSDPVRMDGATGDAFLPPPLLIGNPSTPGGGGGGDFFPPGFFP
jgi:hypothetical protein